MVKEINFNIDINNEAQYMVSYILRVVLFYCSIDCGGGLMGAGYENNFQPILCTKDINMNQISSMT